MDLDLHLYSAFQVFVSHQRALQYLSQVPILKHRWKYNNTSVGSWGTIHIHSYTWLEINTRSAKPWGCISYTTLFMNHIWYLPVALYCLCKLPFWQCFDVLLIETEVVYRCPPKGLKGYFSHMMNLIKKLDKQITQIKIRNCRN